MKADHPHPDSSIRIEKRFVFTATAESAGERLDRFLASKAPDISRARIKSLIESGLARIDGRKTKASQKLKTGQEVELDVPEPTPTSLEPDEGVEFEIIYQDRDIIAVNKPPGLVVHPAAGHWQGTLVHGLLAVVDDLEGVGGRTRPGIVHRLDKDTSGIMVVAKNDKAHQRLVNQFKARDVSKQYLAICVGAPETDSGTIDLPIGRHPIHRKRMSTRSNAGRAAMTLFDVKRRFDVGAGLLHVKILTGRTHQIRVHLASIGYPVLGDRVYGKGPEALKQGGGPLKALVRRHMLHAHRMGLSHPITGEPLNFEAPPAPDMVQVAAALEDGW